MIIFGFVGWSMPGDVNGRHYPTVSLAEARLIFAELKLMRANSRCLATEQRERKAKEQNAQQDRQNQPAAFTVKDVVDLYPTKHCEDRKVNGKIISGVRKPKGQSETWPTLYGATVRVLGDIPAVKVTR